MVDREEEDYRGRGEFVGICKKVRGLLEHVESREKNPKTKKFWVKKPDTAKTRFFDSIGDEARLECGL